MPVRAKAPAGDSMTEKESDKIKTATSVPEKSGDLKSHSEPLNATTGEPAPTDTHTLKLNGRDTTVLPEPKNVSFMSPFPIASAPSDLASADKLTLTKPADTTDLKTSATTPNLETLASPKADDLRTATNVDVSN